MNCTENQVTYLRALTRFEDDNVASDPVIDSLVAASLKTALYHLAREIVSDLELLIAMERGQDAQLHQTAQDALARVLAMPAPSQPPGA